MTDLGCGVLRWPWSASAHAALQGDTLCSDPRRPLLLALGAPLCSLRISMHIPMHDGVPSRQLAACGCCSGTKSKRSVFHLPKCFMRVFCL